MGNKLQITPEGATLFAGVLMLFVMTLCVSPQTHASNRFDLDNLNSIEHFRTQPLTLGKNTYSSFIRHSIQDQEGYLWFSGKEGVMRYDGYELQQYKLSNKEQSSALSNSYLFVDRQGGLFAGGLGLYTYDHNIGHFSYTDVVSDKHIQSIVGDDEGYLWLIGGDFGLIQYDANTQTIIYQHNSFIQSGFPSSVWSAIYDSTDNSIWIATEQGLFKFNLDTHNFTQINLDNAMSFRGSRVRDMAIDNQTHTLWIGTTHGLVGIDTHNLTQTLYRKSHGLLSNNVTTVFIDKSDNLWLGLEKAGICVRRRSDGTFLCLKTAIGKANKLPLATVEDIFEDNQGNIWLAMNHYGVYRLSPSFEKFKLMRDLFANPAVDYFPLSFGGIVRENNDIWIATDGGGINIFNYKTKQFRNLKQHEDKLDSLSSNSIIALEEDEHGDIWAATWEGGVAKINPNTLTVERLIHDPNVAIGQSLAGNNVFSILPDKQGGIWIGVWNLGLQYFDIESKTFTNYIHKRHGGHSNISSDNILHMQLFDNKLFFVGGSNLEYLDLATGTFHVLLQTLDNELNYMLVESLEEIWIATTKYGLIKYNANMQHTTYYNEKHGLGSNVVHYLAKDRSNRLWIATKNGLSILNPENDKITTYYERHGLVTSATSHYGEFVMVEDDVYIPTKNGVSIVKQHDLPEHNTPPKTHITQVQLFNLNDTETRHSRSLHPITDQHIELHHRNNNIAFSFVGLSYIYPEFNRFKYRLNGWQSEFEHANSSNRVARYTNLPAGTYSFELYSANSSGVWDSEGAEFTFSISKPWWATWWGYAVFGLLLVTLFTVAVRLRLLLNLQRERILSLKVKEKTQQLEKNANELERTSKSLAKLNNELEERVALRTSELEKEVNERKLIEEKLYQQAYYDSLTKLPNRQKVIQIIKEMIARCEQQEQCTFAVMFIDGDKFKQVNDTHGHLVGDELLVQAANRLQDLLEDNQYAGRLGGDEFTVILEDTSTNEANKVAECLVDAFKQPFQLQDIILYFEISIGLVICDKSYTKVQDVLKHSDIAMYKAKETGRSRFAVFENE